MGQQKQLLLLSMACLFNAACGSTTTNTDGSCFLEFTLSSSGKELGINDKVLGGDELAQSFTLSEAKNISNVLLPLKKTGMTSSSFADYTVALRIETNLAGQPSGTAVSGIASGASDATVNVTLINSTGNFYTFTLGSTLSLSANTVYWLRVRGTYPASDKDFIQWASHEGTGGYSDGQALYETSTPGSWQSSLIGDLRDLLFKIGC